MKVSIDKGKTLLVDGPASAILLSGKVEVFGHAMKLNEKIVIRDGKRMPIMAEQNSTLELHLGENACVEEYEGSTIPPSWNIAYERLLNVAEKPRVAMILGAPDSGKTSFCTYLANKIVRDGYRVVILDGDLGQSDIGPPCSLAYAVLTRPVTDLFNLPAEDVFFVGETSPRKVVERAIQGFSMLKTNALKHNPDFIIVNTDGWVDGEEAIKYKTRIAEEINPHILFFVQRTSELTNLLNALCSRNVMIVESPPAIKQRSREKWKTLRELGYIKYLANAKVQTIPINWIEIKNPGFPYVPSHNSVDSKRAEEISNILGFNPIHIMELSKEICIITAGEKLPNPEKIKKIEEMTGKKVNVQLKGGEEGFIVALYNASDKFLGLGVIREIDYRRKTIKIMTPVSERFTKVIVGRVKLDKNFKEIPMGAEHSVSGAS
ncbi:MAG: Clp1/GlmU family protein [Candidatus Bathyarchaeia archaeon]